MGVSGVQNGHPTVNSQHRCQCVDDLLAPIRSKMKVLKKIKKRIGIGTPRSGGERFTNNLPPILFHQVHGDNIRISGNGSIARRVESFCRGVTFSDRPIKIQEKVCVKFLEVSNNWSGVIRFGFTCNDPSNLRYSLPKYACPDLTNKPGYWAKALAERFAERDTVLFYYVTATGDVHFGINGEEKGVFFSGVETRGPLWALFDVYGNSTGIELVDQRIPLNNSRRTLVASNEGSPDIDAHILPSLQALSIQNSNQRNSGGGEAQNESNLVSRYQQPGTDLTPLPFHRTRGHNIRMSNDRCVATRSNTEFCLGYVFTARPIQLGEKIIIQVLATESMYVGALAFGLTNCDPSTLETGDLPEDADSLLDRPEYWVVQKDVANNPQRGDELAFSVSQDGEVQISKNGGPPVVFMHVDQTLQLWAFFDVYGSTQKIRILGAAPSPCRNSSSPPPRTDSSSAARFRVNLPCSGESSHGNGPQFIPNCGNILPHPVNQSNGPSPRYCCGSGAASATASPTVPATSTELVQLQPAMGGGTVLVVNLPPAHSNFINHQQQQPKRHSPPSSYHGHHPHVTHSTHGPHSNGIDRLPLSSGTLLSDYSNTYIEPVSSGSYSTMDSTLQWSEGSTGTTTGSECSICYERSIDSVLYMCGHMCMCYDCAIQQWKGKGGGHCPLCRAVIRDVIRTYKS